MAVHEQWPATDSATPKPMNVANDVVRAKMSVTMMAEAELWNLDDSASPNATASAANTKQQKNARITSVAVTPPNKNGSAPTGANITRYRPRYV